MNSSEKQFIEKCKDPVYFCEKVLGVNLWIKQKQILWSIRDNPNTIVVSCNAGGKSFTMACATLWWLFTHKHSLVLTTAPTWRQVVSVLWAEIGRLYTQARVPLGGDFTQGQLKISDKWVALGLPSSEEVRFQGFHAEDILIIFDEAAGIDMPIYTAAAGNLTSKNSRFVLIGNPTSPSGAFYEYSKNPNWNKITISAFDSPAINEPDKYPYLVNAKWIKEREAEWGKDSPMYISRVLGQFPTEGEDTLIPLSWIEAATKRWTERSNKELLVSDHVYLGVDVARYGRDSSVVVTYQPNKVMSIRKHQGRDTVATTHLVTQECISAGSKLIRITIDDTAIGAGVTDNLKHAGYPAVGVNFSQKANNQRHFKRVRDEMYFSMREHFRSGDIAIPPNEALMAQLSGIKYKQIPGGNQIQIESKDEMLERGAQSPDEADALALCLYGAKRIVTARSVHNSQSSGGRSSYKDKQWY